MWETLWETYGNSIVFHKETHILGEFCVWETCPSKKVSEKVSEKNGTSSQSHRDYVNQTSILQVTSVLRIMRSTLGSLLRKLLVGRNKAGALHFRKFASQTSKAFSSGRRGTA